MDDPSIFCLQAFAILVFHGVLAVLVLNLIWDYIRSRRVNKRTRLLAIFVSTIGATAFALECILSQIYDSAPLFHADGLYVVSLIMIVNFVAVTCED